MEIHAGPEHVGIHDKDFFACWTSDLYSLTHNYLAFILNSSFLIVEQIQRLCSVRSR
jgi:hypothetical protein